MDMVEKLVYSEREKVCEELRKFRSQLKFKDELIIREYYGLDDFGIFARRNPVP